MPLFQDIKFFLAHRVPMRDHYKALIEAHGGTIVSSQKDATYVVVDHAKKIDSCGDNYVSFTFIQQSINNKGLEDADSHRIAPKKTRPANSAPPSSSAAGRNFRTPFTEDEDVRLWLYVEEAKKRKASYSGNKIYQEFEASNPRHTFHSWRDRYLRHLEGKPPKKALELQKLQQDSTSPAPTKSAEPQPGKANARTVPPASPPQAPPAQTIVLERQDSNQSTKRNRNKSTGRFTKMSKRTTLRPPDSSADLKGTPASSKAPIGQSASGFTTDDDETLMSALDNIIQCTPGTEKEGWETMAVHYPYHTAGEWKARFDQLVSERAATKQDEEPRAESRQKSVPPEAQEEAIVPSTPPPPTSKRGRKRKADEDPDLSPDVIEAKRHQSIVPSSTSSVRRRKEPNPSRQSLQRSSSPQPLPSLSPSPTQARRKLKEKTNGTVPDKSKVSVVINPPKKQIKSERQRALPQSSKSLKVPSSAPIRSPAKSHTERDVKPPRDPSKSSQPGFVWIDEQQSEKGLNRDFLKEVHRSTCGDLDLGDEVIELVLADQNKPFWKRRQWTSTLRGWWTREDDREVQLGPDQWSKALLDKHEKAGCDFRLFFLGGADDF